MGLFTFFQIFANIVLATPAPAIKATSQSPPGKLYRGGFFSRSYSFSSIEYDRGYWAGRLMAAVDLPETFVYADVAKAAS